MAVNKASPLAILIGGQSYLEVVDHLNILVMEGLGLSE